MNDETSSSAARRLDPARFEREVDGKPVRLFTLRNVQGMVVGITNYGARSEERRVGKECRL